MVAKFSQTDGDEVDSIVAAWAIERPDLDTAPMEIFSRVARLSRHLALAKRTAFAAQELEPWEFDVLSSLRRAGEPYALTPGRLMAETLVSSGTMTNRIDRLEQKGLVSRQPSEQDRRTVMVVITEAGKKRVDSALATLLEEETEMIGAMTSEDQKKLATSLRSLLLPFDRP